jgi:N-acetylmuramoyl-L-alanine amidase
MKNTVEYIFIHCSATPEGRHHNANDIDRWHKAKGWRGIGYHYVILIDGTIEEGRPLDTDEWLEADEVGAQAYGYNRQSIGICYIGGTDKKGKPKDTRTMAQTFSLNTLLLRLVQQFPKAQVKGHNEVDPGKACPSFDVQEWLKTIDLCRD